MIYLSTFFIFIKGKRNPFGCPTEKKKERKNVIVNTYENYERRI